MHCSNGHVIDDMWFFKQNDIMEEEMIKCPECNIGGLHSGTKEKCWSCEATEREKERERNYNIPPTPIQGGPELCKVHEFHDMKRDWLGYLGYQMQIRAVPTEMVVYEPEMVVPKYGRSFITDMVLREGNLYNFRELQKHIRDFNHAESNAVMLHEYWANGGDDGHIIYQFRGFVFIDSETYDKLHAKYKSDYRHEAMAHWRLLDNLDFMNELGRRG
jgi:hypothetical protein